MITNWQRPRWCPYPRVLTGTATLFAVFSLFGIFGCSARESIKKAEGAVPVFHSNYNAGNYSKIFSDAHQLFRGNDTEDDNSKYFDRIHNVMGDCKASKVTSSTYVANTLASPRVSLSYITTFANGDATEDFAGRSTHTGRNSLVTI